MINVKSFYSLLFSIFFICSSFLVTIPVYGFEPGKMQSIQDELEEANRAIEEYVASLSPEEQEEFNRSVNEISQMFENMSEDEFESFLSEMFSEEPLPEPSPEFYSSSQSDVAAETPVITAEQKKKVETIILVLDDIIRQSNVLMVQINSSLETSNRINQWMKKGKIANIPSGATWSSLMTDIEKFVQQLYTLQHKDTTKQTYKYIASLMEDESLINNLVQLQSNLNSSVPHIEISVIDIQKLSPSAKNAIINALQHYAESLYLLNIPQSINTLFEKHAPEDVKSKEAAEAAEKKAADALKRPRTPVSSSSVGASAESSSLGSYGGSYDSGYSHYGSNYGSSYGGDYGYGGNYGGSSWGDFGSSGSGSGSDLGGGSSGGGSSSSGGRGGTAGGGTPEGTDQKFIPQPQHAPGPKNVLIKELVNNVQDELKKIQGIIKKNTAFSIINEHITATEKDVAVDINIAKDIIEINNIINSTMIEVQSLKTSMLKASKGTQGRYNESLATATNKLIILDKLSEDIAKIEKDQKKLKISPEKKWAYLADDKAEAAIKKLDNGTEILSKLEKDLPKRVSLFELRGNINKLSGAIKELISTTKQEPAPQQQQPLNPVAPIPAPTIPGQNATE
jgi:hypothetical protein